MMFLATVRNTLRTLLRSVSFRLVFAVFAFIQLRHGLQDHVVAAPGFSLPPQLSFPEYAQLLDGVVYGGSLIYPLAILTVVSTALVMNRDYGDSFYEVEKAAGVKPARYLFGRLCAIIALVFLVQFLLSFTAMHISVYRRGGLEGYSALGYFGDSLLRLLRMNLCMALPQILFFVGVTQLLGSLFRNGFAASIGGIAYALASYALLGRFRYSGSEAWYAYYQYFSPMPEKLRYYLLFLGWTNEQEMLELYGCSFGKAAFCIAFLTGVFVACACRSYCLVRRREI